MTEKIRVLMIDDEADLNLMVKDNLEDTGEFEVVTETRADDPVVLCQEIRPDGILLDKVMPGKQGAQIAKILKEDERTHDSPIIMVSGKGEFIYSFKREQFPWRPNLPLARKAGDQIRPGRNYEELARAYGVDDYDFKPFRIEILVEVIKDVLKRCRKRKSEEEPPSAGMG